MPILRRWDIKAVIIFSLTCFANVCQYSGPEVLGTTFDPVDIACYAVGVLVAAFVDAKVFSPYHGFWNIEKFR